MRGLEIDRVRVKFGVLRRKPRWVIAEIRVFRKFPND